jgi:hypothetical protein
VAVRVANSYSAIEKPGGNFVVLDLAPATWYNLKVTAHNNAGFSIAEYEFATLTATGGTLAPARELGGDGKADTGTDELEQRIMYFLTNLNLVVPVVAALIIIIIAIIVIITIIIIIIVIVTVIVTVAAIVVVTVTATAAVTVTVTATVTVTDTATVTVTVTATVLRRIHSLH